MVRKPERETESRVHISIISLPLLLLHHIYRLQQNLHLQIPPPISSPHTDAAFNKSIIRRVLLLVYLPPKSLRGSQEYIPNPNPIVSPSPDSLRSVSDFLDLTI